MRFHPEVAEQLRLPPRSVFRHLEELKIPNVAYVAGTSFFCDGGGQNTMRLNFSYESEENNLEGCRRMGEFMKKAVLKLS